MTSSPSRTNYDCNSPTLNRILNDNNTLQQGIVLNDKRRNAMKKIQDPLEHTKILEANLPRVYNVIFEHIKEKIPTLGLGSNFDKYIISVPDDLFCVWKFGQERYDMHSTETKSSIREAIEKTKTKKKD